jgi:hypothetical protein
MDPSLVEIILICQAHSLQIVLNHQKLFRLLKNSSLAIYHQIFHHNSKEHSLLHPIDRIHFLEGITHRQISLLPHLFLIRLIRYLFPCLCFQCSPHFFTGPVHPTHYSRRCLMIRYQHLILVALHLLLHFIAKRWHHLEPIVEVLERNTYKWWRKEQLKPQLLPKASRILL